jgi:hypothetical protein
MVEDIDLKKLSPEERIKKLKELEEKSKKEIEKAQKLIKESEEEIAIEQKLKDVEIPDSEEIDVTKLFKKEESLEETVEKEKITISEEDLREQHEYFKELPTRRIEERAEYLQRRVDETGYVNNNQALEMAAMYQEIREREDGLRQGNYKPMSARVEEELNMAKGIARKVLGEFYNSQ